jgi:histidinol-phosphate aminotransferase
MNRTSPLNRRQWLKATGATLAGLALTSRLTATPAATPALPLATITPEGFVQLSLNENAFGPSPRAIAAMQAHLGQVGRYPFALTPRLVATIAAKEGVTPEHIQLGVGSGELLEVYGMYFGRDKGEVVSAAPGYMQFIGAMQRMGTRAVTVPLNDRLEHDLDAMAAAVGPDTKCVYICNPNNPTGTLVAAAKLRAFALEVSKRVPVFIDEAYLDCADDYAGNTMVDLVRDGHDVTIARTFSKIHGLAGQRIGYAVTSPARAKAIRPFLGGSVNLLGVVAAQASVDDPGYIEALRRRIKAGRDALIAVLNELGCRYAEPQGSFVFFQTGRPIAEFQAAMRAEGILVARPFPPLLDWCRITIGTEEEMVLAHAAIRKVLG